jgi:hypothetical protein
MPVLKAIFLQRIADGNGYVYVILNQWLHIILLKAEMPCCTGFATATFA